MLRSLQEQVDSGEAPLGAMINELSACRGVDPEGAPLLRAALDGTTEHLCQEGMIMWQAQMARLPAIIGTRDEEKASTLVHNTQTRTTHIWPEGKGVLDRWGQKGKTLCGVTFFLTPARGWRMSHRGSFALVFGSPIAPGMSAPDACERCAKKAQERQDELPEAFERSGRPHALWPETHQAMEERLRHLLRAALLDSPREGARPETVSTLTGEALGWALAQEACQHPRHALRAGLRSEALRRRELKEEFAVHEESRELRSFVWAQGGKGRSFSEWFAVESSALEGLISSLLSEEDWQGMLGELMAGLGPGSMAPGSPDARTAQESWGGILATRVRQRLIAHGLPGAEPLSLPWE
jgi:hypothetical protein